MQISDDDLARFFSSGSIGDGATDSEAPLPSRRRAVSFTIDPTLSSYHIVNIQTDAGSSPPSPLQLSTILGTNAVPQTTGEDTDALSGTINADLTGGVLTFSGNTSTITLAANPNAPFSPNPGSGNAKKLRHPGYHTGLG